jgi:hypothetical protein
MSVKISRPKTCDSTIRASKTVRSQAKEVRLLGALSMHGSDLWNADWLVFEAFVVVALSVCKALWLEEGEGEFSDFPLQPTAQFTSFSYISLSSAQITFRVCYTAWWQIREIQVCNTSNLRVSW